MKKTVLTDTKKTFRLELGREDILHHLINVYGDVPKDVRIFVRVPGGGDWSNTELDIGDDATVIVEWEESSREEGEIDG